jgi:hypothetical protein
LDRTRHRSVGYLDHEGENWACFLVTFQERDGTWKGYFSFRQAELDAEGQPTSPGAPEQNGESPVRTADIFVERSESEIERKARGLGRPLLSGLLSSAIHTWQVEQARTPRLQMLFQEILAEGSRELAEEGEGLVFEDPDAWKSEGDADAEPAEAGPGGAALAVQSPPAPPVERVEEGGTEAPAADQARLRSMYASYRLDQVAHFIALVDPMDFEETVDRILEGQAVDFGTKDRIQFAMMVVEYIETLLPLPPFEVWSEDYLAHPDEYALYAHTLHREGKLP